MYLYTSKKETTNTHINNLIKKYKIILYKKYFEVL